LRIVLASCLVRGASTTVVMVSLVRGHGSGSRGGCLPAAGSRPVREHRDRGREQGSRDGDQGDLPAGHATTDDRVGRDTARNHDRVGRDTARNGVPPTSCQGDRAGWLAGAGSGGGRVANAGVAPNATRAAASPARTPTKRRMCWMGPMSVSFGSG